MHNEKHSNCPLYCNKTFTTSPLDLLKPNFKCPFYLDNKSSCTPKNTGYKSADAYWPSEKFM